MTRFAALSLGAGVLLAGCGEVAYDAIDEGNRAYERGDYESADEHYQIADAALHDVAALHYNRGNATFRLGLQERAEELYSLALRTDDPHLASRIQYNLGRIKHGLAIHNVRGYQTAIPPLREAIGFYRGSLALDPHYEDALYNLALAQRLLEDLERRQAEEEDEARTRKTSYSPRMGQAFDETAPDPNPGADDAETEVQMRPQGGEALQGPRGNTDTEARGATDHGESSRELTPDEAEALVEMIRGRARGAQGLHQGWSRLLDPEAEDGKDW